MQTPETPAIIRKITSIKFSIQVQVAVNGREAKEKAQAEPGIHITPTPLAQSLLWRHAYLLSVQKSKTTPIFLWWLQIMEHFVSDRT